MTAPRDRQNDDDAATGNESQVLAKHSPTELLEIYRVMVLARSFDAACQRNLAAGSIAFHVPAAGSEAITVGAAAALAPNDWLLPSFRGAGLALWRGVSVEELMQQMAGTGAEPSRGRQSPGLLSSRSSRIVSMSSPVGTQISQAAGIAHAARLRGNDEVVLACFGARACDSPDFHAGVNFAGVFRSPVIFLCDGNGARLEARGAAYGLRVESIDGDDVVAVYESVLDAAARARNGEGAVLIEATRSQSEAARDPIELFEAYLEEDGVLTSKLRGDIRQAADAELDGAERAMSETAPQDETEIFDEVLAVPGADLERQRAAWRRFRAEYGGRDDSDGDFLASGFADSTEH